MFLLAQSGIVLLCNRSAKKSCAYGAASVLHAIISTLMQRYFLLDSRIVGSACQCLKAESDEPRLESSPPADEQQEIPRINSRGLQGFSGDNEIGHLEESYQQE